MLVVCREGTLGFCEEPSAFLTCEDFKTFTVFFFVEFVCCANGCSFCYVYLIFRDL